MLCEEADKRYRANAETLQLKYCKGKRKKTMFFCSGNFVSVGIPRLTVPQPTIIGYCVLSRTSAPLVSAPVRFYAFYSAY